MYNYNSFTHRSQVFGAGIDKLWCECYDNHSFLKGAGIMMYFAFVYADIACLAPDGSTR